MHRFPVDRFSITRLRPRAREMRNAPTPSEVRLWSVLRNRALGVKFRRQVVLGAHIVDFFAPSIGLVVEVDGPVHDALEDEARDACLRARGFRVVRVSAAQVMRDLHGVAHLIAESIARA